MYIVADFGKMTTIDDYRTTVGTKLKGIDIAALFLNVGVASVGHFVDQSDADVESQMTINALANIYTAKVLLGQMLDRGKRCAIVTTSSGCG